MLYSRENSNTPGNLDRIDVRNPTIADGAVIYGLVTRDGVLDKNSCYAYLLLCRHFCSTCVVACRGPELVGFVTAYIPPQQPETIFVWQVAVDASARRQGLGQRMLRHLLTLPACSAVRCLEATVSPSNSASRRLFESLAEALQTRFEIDAGFEPEHFANKNHEAEPLVRIGPWEKNSCKFLSS